LKSVELLEERTGKNIHQFASKEAVLAFEDLATEPDLYCLAYEEALKLAGEGKMTGAIAKGVTAAVAEYKAHRDELDEQFADNETWKPLTYTEWWALHNIGEWDSEKEGLTELAHDENRPLAAVCKEHRSLPDEEELLAFCRGQELIDLALDLEGLRSIWEAEETAKKKTEETKLRLLPMTSAAQVQQRAPPQAQPAGTPEEEKEEEEEYLAPGDFAGVLFKTLAHTSLIGKHK